ncbi:MAG: D-glycerate dehydrogenase [Thalassospira sp.]|uniref:2-hydroxyacid dehydrogenase n=1 Tax=Thalassospira TaxID=168934 RepID=UPI00028739DE|nr:MULTISPECIES: D-glycerate dehydrogenase [Thalassospira]EKF08923.1 glycolate reductase [Thalassospira profundimaris WP0211]KZD01209.1 D-glycerate dehydrogenase [Thalassospira sp. MCCC 1A02898]MBE70098.1 D-glycerate dehydrogenase [Thalassospira sp.]ONH85459.1 dihydrofolate reductase [Thalassospira sp. MCCC 1A02803]|tara:strand:+ start:1291 stop:2256 length:966 start_codon:yes stop_codon:yes gene_type:complete
MPEKPKLLITRRLRDAVQARAARDYQVLTNAEDRVFTREELIEKCQQVDAVLPCHSEHFSADVIAELPKSLKIIANHSVGVDHVDLAAAKDAGIVVTNTPDVLSDATAEIAMLCMLGAARRGAEGDAMVRAGKWDFWSPAFMVGRQVTGKRFGVLGMGRVGQVAAERARGFGMEVHYHNRKPLPDHMAKGAIFHETVEDLFAHSDVLSLHCPSTPETKGIINSKTIAMLPDRAILVNTARGNLVDEDALVAALQSGKLFAAGLDVFCNEPGGNQRISALNNVFLLPHIGSATEETRDAMGFRALDNLDAYFQGKEPGDRVA